MNITFIKQPGGGLTPASDIESERMSKLKTGGAYTLTIKQSRNPVFHGKMFAFLNFCFEHWQGGNKYQNEAAQFEEFRKNLTILAGYKIVVVTMRGELRVRAQSLSFGSMKPEVFEQCYHAMIQAAITNVFSDADENTINRLYDFF